MLNVYTFLLGTAKATSLSFERQERKKACMEFQTTLVHRLPRNVFITRTVAWQVRQESQQPLNSRLPGTSSAAQGKAFAVRCRKSSNSFRLTLLRSEFLPGQCCNNMATQSNCHSYIPHNATKSKPPKPILELVFIDFNHFPLKKHPIGLWNYAFCPSPVDIPIRWTITESSREGLQRLHQLARPSHLTERLRKRVVFVCFSSGFH